MSWATLAVRVAVGAAAVTVFGATLYVIYAEPWGGGDALPGSWVLAGWPAMLRGGAVPPPPGAEPAEGGEGEDSSEEGEEGEGAPSETTTEQGSSYDDAPELELAVDQAATATAPAAAAEPWADVVPAAAEEGMDHTSPAAAAAQGMDHTGPAAVLANAQIDEEGEEEEPLQELAVDQAAPATALAAATEPWADVVPAVAEEGMDHTSPAAAAAEGLEHTGPAAAPADGPIAQIGEEGEEEEPVQELQALDQTLAAASAVRLWVDVVKAAAAAEQAARAGPAAAPVPLQSALGARGLAKEPDDDDWVDARDTEDEAAI